MKNAKYFVIALGLLAVGIAAYTYFSGTSNKAKRRNIQIVRN